MGEWESVAILAIVRATIGRIFGDTFPSPSRPFLRRQESHSVVLQQSARIRPHTPVLPGTLVYGELWAYLAGIADENAAGEGRSPLDIPALRRNGPGGNRRFI